ncbi:MAG: outer membrane protein assembly factor BamD [Candidatus Omnitrophica bacterium]|nr:outer membrane protein assembly factor BamD [Candidatus Omnitrophota bacterium]
MKKRPVVLFVFLILLGAAGTSQASWMWSPDIGKWINPKKAAKDTPEEQFAWAQDFYQKKDWDRAIEEFEKLPGAFPNSRLAAEAVYYTGLSWEQKQDTAKAADAYQKLIDRYPYSDRIKDAVKREFDIANEFAAGGKLKVLGVPALPGQEKALELYKHIVKNAPFGTYGDQAQFKIGELYKSQGEYEEAQKAFQTVVDEYPSSTLVAQARYQIAYSSMQASKKSQYNETYADRAIEEFQGFKENFPASKQSVEAEEAIKALRNKKAMTQLDVADFYEKQNKFASARVYYQDLITQYPETPASAEARKRLDGIVKEGK